MSLRYIYNVSNTLVGQGIYSLYVYLFDLYNFWTYGKDKFLFYNSLMIEDTHKIVNWLKMKLEISLTTTQRKTTLSDNLYWKIMVSAVLCYMYNVNTLSKPLLCIIQAQLTKTNRFLFFTKTSLPNHETTKYDN